MMAKIRKALVAAFAAAVAALLGALAQGGVPGDTTGWLAVLGTAVSAALVAGYATWRVPNDTTRRLAGGKIRASDLQ